MMIDSIFDERNCGIVFFICLVLLHDFYFFKFFLGWKNKHSINWNLFLGNHSSMPTEMSEKIRSTDKTKNYHMVV